jgi:hypothetical protein
MKTSKLPSALLVFGLFILIIFIGYQLNKTSDGQTIQSNETMAPGNRPLLNILKKYPLNKYSYQFFDMPEGYGPSIDREDRKTLVVVLFRKGQQILGPTEWKYKQYKPFEGIDYDRIGFRLTNNYSGDKPFFNLTLKKI